MFSVLHALESKIEELLDEWICEDNNTLLNPPSREDFRIRFLKNIEMVLIMTLNKAQNKFPPRGGIKGGVKNDED